MEKLLFVALGLLTTLGLAMGSGVIKNAKDVAVIHNDMGYIKGAVKDLHEYHFPTGKK